MREIQAEAKCGHGRGGNILITAMQRLLRRAYTSVALECLVTHEFTEACSYDYVVPKSKELRSLSGSVEPGLQRTNLSALARAVNSGKGQNSQKTPCWLWI